MTEYRVAYDANPEASVPQIFFRFVLLGVGWLLLLASLCVAIFIVISLLCYIPFITCGTVAIAHLIWAFSLTKELGDERDENIAFAVVMMFFYLLAALAFSTLVSDLSAKRLEYLSRSSTSVYSAR